MADTLLHCIVSFCFVLYCIVLDVNNISSVDRREKEKEPNVGCRLLL